MDKTHNSPRHKGRCKYSGNSSYLQRYTGITSKELCEYAKRVEELTRRYSQPQTIKDND